MDETTNEPLIGVSVILKGTNSGTITDYNGKYTISAETNSLLVFSYIGYTDVELVLHADDDLYKRVFMREDTKELEEVVVVGYGIQTKASLVGSISALKGEELQKVRNVTTVSEALQGMMAGVTSVMVDGKPGADDAQITIRGNSSWQSSDPLIMVDGVERDMNDVDPNEIESLSVLKDASATAVYGVKGANGVILITTKRGTKEKPKISLTANFGFKQPLTHPEYTDYVTAMHLWNEGAVNDLAYSSLIPESTIAAWENAYATGNIGPYNQYFPTIDWYNEIIRPVSLSEQYNLNIRGGSEFMKYFTSIGYLHDGDVYNTQKTDMFDPAFSYKRFNWRANFDFNITKSTTLAINLAGKQGYRSQTGYRADGNNENDDAFGQERFFKTLYNAPRNVFPIKYDDGYYGVSSNAVQSDNLFLLFELGQRIYKYNQNFIDVSLKQNLDFITKGLNFSGKLAYNAESNAQTRLQRYSGGNFGEVAYIAYYREWDYTQILPGGGYALKREQRSPTDDPEYQGRIPLAAYDNLLDGGYSNKLYYELALNYTRSFDLHNISLLALMNRNENNMLKRNSVSEMDYEYKDEAWVTRMTYNWNERYLAEFNGAYTGSYKFAPGLRFHFFPSYSIGWRASEEPFIKNTMGSYLNNLKFRYSYGIVGYDRYANPFTYIQLYSNDGGGINFGKDVTTSYGPLYTEGSAANINATWETAYKQNFGIETKIFNRLTGSFDLYSENREGILMSVYVPGWFGNTASAGNIGRTKSRGFEIELAWQDNLSKNWQYWIKGNYSFNENRVVFRDDPAYLSEYLKNAGKPIRAAYKLQNIGYYESLDDIFNYTTPNNKATQTLLVPGDLMYLDYDSDGVIDMNKDKIPQKYNSFPRVTYGWTVGLSYKSIQFSAMFYGVSQIYKEVDGSVLWDMEYGNNGIYSANTDAPGRWNAANPSDATKPSIHVLSQNRGYSMIGGTTFSFQDASYVRLKNLEISYLIDRSILNRAQLGINNIELYVNGNNLLTFTKFNRQLDPEGSSVSVYPMVRRFNFGTRVTF